MAAPGPETSTRSGVGPSDAGLVVAARAGEAWAKEALFRRHAKMVNGLAFRLMGRDADVDDLVQESFVRALGSLHQLNAPQAFASWLSGIVIRTAHKILRRRRLLARLRIHSHDPVDLDLVVSRTAPPDVASELRAIYRKVDQFPPKVRLALLLRRVDGLPLEEIATQMKISLSTVKRCVARGEKLLEDSLVTKWGVP